MRTGFLKIALLLMIGLTAAAGPAIAQQTPAKKASIVRTIPESNERRNVFSGNEARLSVMNYVNSDCSAGPMPDVRIVTPPTNGELRFEQIKYAVSRSKENSRHHCNGKIVDAVGVFYKSKEKYTGSEKAVVDVDFRDGTVRRFVYSIEVR
jgi:hypothetical protein